MEEERKKAENMTSLRDKSINNFYAGNPMRVSFYWDFLTFGRSKKEF
jgi:hypothetical protein